MEPLISVRSVTRRFGDVVALDDVSLEVGAGEMVGLLGPNGAGKTTLLSLVNGQRKPDAGVVRLFGADPRKPAARAMLGTTPQETGLPPTLKVGEVVDFVAGHYADPMPRGELLERFDLAGLAGRQTGGLSGGQKRRLAVALSLVGRPRLVLLDEPTTGLDVEGRRALWQALRDYHADGATIVLTSHYLEEVEALAQRVVVIGGGRVLADDALPAVLDRVSVRRVALTAQVPASELLRLPGVVDIGDGPADTSREAVTGSADAVAAAATVADTLPAGSRYSLLVSDSDAFVRALVASGLPFSGLEVRGASLEEAFLTLTHHHTTTRDAAPEPAFAASAGDSESHGEGK
ncbi:ABC transporter ATP-binding protein [Arthrobacter sp. CAU 1506]|uniref:ABC transporter ATP-binding protein n=1 Tax=Arthrobacter sp. CAU 1506 TaxID=2560052 RepID=UPI0010AC4373|nr:ABC transporter ATP-binding protein [Arthrobacter sp. CAU 1506]TJY64065.1 ABC transporter ATP-binding protein [Arthrobacter sp. CAU 1506]